MNCYIKPQKSFIELPKNINKLNTIFYPEQTMTLDDKMKTGKPLDKNIVTDCPFLVPVFYADEVFVFKDNKWVSSSDLGFNPYGTSYNIIKTELFGYSNSIPQGIINGEITNIMGYKIKLEKNVRNRNSEQSNKL